MRQTMTTINDVRQWVDERLGDGWEGRVHLVFEIAHRIRDSAHAAGLRYGEDWSEFLAGVDLQTLAVEAASDD